MQCSNSANISLFGECRKWFTMLPPYDPIYLCSQNSQKHSLLQYIFVFVNAQHLQVPLVWMSLNHLVTLSWWQVLLCLWLYWCLQLSALLSWLSGGGRSLTLMSIQMLLLYTHSINCVEVEPLFRKHGNMRALEL